MLPYYQLVNSKWEKLIPANHLENARASYHSQDGGRPKKEHTQLEDENLKLDPLLAQKLNDKLALIMKEYGLRRGQITVDIKHNAVTYPHENHFHAEPIDEKKPFSGGRNHCN
ncbi:hypothetical protein [Streptococcus catagoni]|uniref:hypothetical protein n=1 Tax=Streptococcus catagoni TaxID=2654874 RepID=UPI001F263BEA|nr:hypothetical protein [Streptococcus catagoni]